VKDIQIEQMNYLQNWIEQLNPLAAFPSIAMLFLIASIAGWYVGPDPMVPPMTTTPPNHRKSLPMNLRCHVAKYWGRETILHSLSR